MINEFELRKKIHEYDPSIILANTWIDNDKLTGILLLPFRGDDEYIQVQMKPLTSIPEKIDCLNRLVYSKDIEEYQTMKARLIMS
jgi:hypothetical protein